MVGSHLDYSIAVWYPYKIKDKIATENVQRIVTKELPGITSLKWLYSKQPKLGLTHEFVVDCGHALWVHSTKGLVSLKPIRPHASESVRPCFPHGARKRPLGKKDVEVASSGGLI